MTSQSVTDSRSIISILTPRLPMDFWITIGLLVHIPLALLLRTSSQLSTLHALSVAVIGLFMVLRRAPIEQFAYLGAYITGAEVLWRMTTDGGVFWEYGKYVTIAILTLALIRHRALKMPIPAVVYFLLLIPGIIMPFFTQNWSTTRDALSFYLSGPLALATCAWFFSHVKLSKQQAAYLLWALAIPVVSIATLTFASVQMVNNWSLNSNDLASGDFGANQVSSTLGLGLLAVWLLLLYTQPRRFVKLIALLLSIWFLVQALLTFSRGGVLTALIPGILITLLIALEKKQRRRIIPIAIGFFIFALLLIPALNALTKGALIARFTEADKKALTGRDDIVRGELLAFAEHPIWGLGLGQSGSYRAEFFGGDIASHTEYTRMLADHGLLGLAAILMLVLMFVQNLRRNWNPLASRSTVISVVLWSLIYLVHAAMRTVAPSFVFAIQFARFDFGSDERRTMELMGQNERVDSLKYAEGS